MDRKEVVALKEGTTLTAFVAAVASNTLSDVLDVHPAYEVGALTANRRTPVASPVSISSHMKPDANVMIMRCLPSLIVAERSPTASAFGLGRGLYRVSATAELVVAHAEWPVELEYMNEAQIQSLASDNIVVSAHTDAWVYVGGVVFCSEDTRVVSGSPPAAPRGAPAIPKDIPRSVVRVLEEAADEADEVTDGLSLIRHQLNMSRVVCHSLPAISLNGYDDPRAWSRSLRAEPRTPPRNDVNAIYVDNVLYVASPTREFTSAAGVPYDVKHPRVATSGWIAAPATYISFDPVVQRYTPSDTMIAAYVSEEMPTTEGESDEEYEARILPRIAERILARDAQTPWSFGSGAPNVTGDWPEFDVTRP